MLVGLHAPKDQWDLKSWQSWAGYWPTVICSILIISISTRLLSSLLGGGKTTVNGVKTVPLLPYWIPIIGHIPNLGLAGDSLLSHARNIHKGGVFALNLGGATHNILYSPALSIALMHQKSSVADSQGVIRSLMCTVFGFPKAELDKYDRAVDDLLACYRHLMSDPSLGTMVQKTIDMVTMNIANLVTFSSSVVDQTEWERTSDVNVVTTPNREQVVEANLL